MIFFFPTSISMLFYHPIDALCLPMEKLPVKTFRKITLIHLT